MVVEPNLEIAISILIDPALIRDQGQDHTHHGHAAFLLREAAEATGAGKRRHHRIEEGDEEVQVTPATLAIAIAAEVGIGPEVGMDGTDRLEQQEQSCSNMIPRWSRSRQTSGQVDSPEAPWTEAIALNLSRILEGNRDDGLLME